MGSPRWPAYVVELDGVTRTTRGGLRVEMRFIREGEAGSVLPQLKPRQRPGISGNSDLPTQDPAEVDDLEGVAVEEPRRTARLCEVGERRGRFGSTFAVHLEQHELTATDRDRHDRVAVIPPQRPAAPNGREVVGEDVDLGPQP